MTGSVAPSPDPHSAALARGGAAAALAPLWRALRADLLAVHAALPERVDRRREWNLPLWELGHVAWFAERWTLRQPEPWRGAACDPEQALPPGRAADAFYNSSAVPHAARWQLPLPDRAATHALLDAQLHASLARLSEQPHEDNALYLFRLSLLHEAMHVEAAHLLARALRLTTPAPQAQAAGAELQVPAQTVTLGMTLGNPGSGFAFDNECAGRAVAVPAFRVDARVRRWGEVLPWVEQAYTDDRLWSAAGLAWRGPRRHPEALRGGPGDWQRTEGQQPLDLDPAAPAEPLSAFEAEAWCAWAGRRLLREAEWQAAQAQPGFAWGEVWEWSADVFAPFPGFRPHPYRDYSAPWFDGRHRLLRGASRFTPAVLAHPGFRNFYLPDRSDLVAGLRSAAR